MLANMGKKIKIKNYSLKTWRKETILKT